MNNLKILQGLGALIIAVSVVLSGCAAPEEQVPTEVTIEVTPDEAFVVELPEVGTLSGGQGAVSRPGTITISATPGEDADPGIALEAVGTGLRVEIEGTTLLTDLDLTFEGPGSVPDAIPVLLHQADNGDWDLREAAVDGDGRVVVATRDFSLTWPAWLNPVTVLGPIFDSVTDALIGRTDPDPCLDDGPEWASLDQRTTLVHNCLITNTSDTGVVRAEAQLKANRRFFTLVTLPAGADYVWNEKGDAWAGNLLATWIPAASGPNKYLLFPQARITAGYLQPPQDVEEPIVIYLDQWTAALSLTWTVLTTLVPGLDERGGWAALTGLAVCADEVPASGDDADGWFGYMSCVMTDGLETLLDPEKALRVAVNTLGDVLRGDMDAALDVIGKSEILQLVGKVFKIAGLAFLVRDIFQQIPDAFSQMGNDRPGDVLLQLRAPGPMTDITQFATQSGVVCNLEPETTGYPEQTASCYAPRPEFRALLVNEAGTDLYTTACPAALVVLLPHPGDAEFFCFDHDTQDAPILPPGSTVQYGGYICQIESDAIHCTLTLEDETVGFVFSNQNFQILHGDTVTFDASTDLSIYD